MSYSLFSDLKNRLFWPLIFVSLFFTSVQPALAVTKTLMINPVRVIFTDRQRAITLSVGNPTDQPISYAISLITMRRGENGKLYNVEPGQETAEELFSKKLIRFSPRRATVEPNKRQVVKLMVRKPTNLPFGEYQTRLKITPQARNSAPVQTKTTDNNDKPQINLELYVGISLPIIIQHGVSDSEVTPITLSLDNLVKSPSGIAANVSLSRRGSFSAFGDIQLTYISSIGGKEKEIGKARGVAIYLPKNKQNVTIYLKDIARQELKSGTIRVDYFPYQGQNRRKKRKKQQVISTNFMLR